MALLSLFEFLHHAAKLWRIEESWQRVRPVALLTETKWNWLDFIANWMCSFSRRPGVEVRHKILSAGPAIWSRLTSAKWPATDVQSSVEVGWSALCLRWFVFAPPPRMLRDRSILTYQESPPEDTGRSQQILHTLYAGNIQHRQLIKKRNKDLWWSESGVLFSVHSVFRY